MIKKQPYYDLRNKPGWSFPDKYHVSYGIQYWLSVKGFCLWEDSKNRIDKEQYKELLKEFCLFNNPDFDFSKVKGIESYEEYVQRRFDKFCQFCAQIYYKKSTNI